MESGGRDPQSGLGYTYLRFKDKKSVQLMAMFESEGWGTKLAMRENTESEERREENSGEKREESTSHVLGSLAFSSLSNLTLSSNPTPLSSLHLSDTVYALEDYSSKFPGTFGKKLGVFVEASTNTPINETTNYSSGLNLGLPSVSTSTGFLVVGNTSSGTIESLS